MTAADTYESDEIEALLDGSASPAGAGEQLRRELLLRTSRVIRRRRHVRRAGILGAVACAYLAGVLTVSLRSSQTDIVVVDRSDTSQAASSRDPVDDVPPAAATTLDNAHEYRLGEVADLNRYEVFCRAAERHLNETGDYTAALNLYRQALNAASEDQLAIAAGRDTWLLLALKNARQQERTDAVPEI